MYAWAAEVPNIDNNKLKGRQNARISVNFSLRNPAEKARWIII